MSHRRRPRAVPEPERIFLFAGGLARACGGRDWPCLHYQDRVSSDDAEVDGHITAIAPKIGGNVVEVRGAR